GDSLETRVCDWIDGRVLVTDEDAVGLPAARILESHLPIDCVGAEKPEVHSGIASGLHRIVHGLRPVFIVTDGKKAPIIQDAVAICVSIDVGRVVYVVTKLLHPADEVDLPTEKRLA